VEAKNAALSLVKAQIEGLGCAATLDQSGGAGQALSVIMRWSRYRWNKKPDAQCWVSGFLPNDLAEAV